MRRMFVACVAVLLSGCDYFGKPDAPPLPPAENASERHIDVKVDHGNIKVDIERKRPAATNESDSDGK